MKVFNAVVAVGALLATGSAALADGDAAKGKSVFNQCKACHALDKAVVGPPLGGVVGRKAGSVAGYSYSSLMKEAGEAGLVWNDQELVEYLKNPTEYLKGYLTSKGKTGTGASKMVFMLPNETQRQNVVAYLNEQKAP